MLLKPVQNEEEKMKPEKRRFIIHTNAMYRITFGMIVRWFQDLDKGGTDDEKNDIVADEQKGRLRGSQGCTDHIANIQL
jgi:hypothetical protein